MAQEHQSPSGLNLSAHPMNNPLELPEEEKAPQIDYAEIGRKVLSQRKVANRSKLLASSDPYQPIKKVNAAVNQDVQSINENNKVVAEAEQQAKDQKEEQSQSSQQEGSDPSDPYNLKPVAEHLLGISKDKPESPQQSNQQSPQNEPEEPTSLDPLTSALQKILGGTPDQSNEPSSEPSDSNEPPPSQPRPQAPSSQPVENLLSQVLLK